MKEICEYKPLFSKKRKKRIEGNSKGYDEVFSRNREFVVFRNNLEDNKEYYLYSLKTGKLLLGSKNVIIELFEAYNEYNYSMENFFYMKKNNSETMYLFKINSDSLKDYDDYVYILEIDDVKSVELGKNISTFTFISKYKDYYCGCNLFFTAENEIFTINENYEKEDIESPFKCNSLYGYSYSSHCEYGIFLISYKYLKSEGYKYYSNLYDFKTKKFILKNFINKNISSYKVYNDKIYIFNQNREIFDENGNYLISDPLAQEIIPHPRLPYVFTKRNDRIGLISLEERKILYKPLYIEILVDEEEVMLLDRVGGAYKTVMLCDR